MSLHRTPRPLARHALAWIGLAAIVAAAGCSKDARSPVAPAEPTAIATGTSALAPPTIVDQRGDQPPAGVVDVAAHGSQLALWPYTGNGFDGSPVDPINLVFAGNADPRTIRAALMALDGDRTALGFPDEPPFNQRWTDAFGDVQTAWSGAEGWTGSVVQLALGDYQPARFHLRLFRTGETPGAWTLGGAHFEVLIPGTTDHQVLSWERAREIVVADLLRAGLLMDTGATGPISAAPTYRDILWQVYNELPPSLRAYIGGPAENQTSNIPIPNDGNAVTVMLGGTPSYGESSSQSFTIPFGLAIPKPLCADGPYDWVYVEGPVSFERTTIVDADGTYRYTGHASGRLTVTPVDITANPPVPIGPSFPATVSEDQEGVSGMGVEQAFARSRRIAGQRGGAERLTVDLKVAWDGPKKLRLSERCLEPEP